MFDTFASNGSFACVSADTPSLPPPPVPWTETTVASEAKRLLDDALASLTECGHLVPYIAESRNFRWLIEYAGAFIREGWIAADGQNAQSPAGTFLRCQQGQRLVEWAVMKAEQEAQTARDVEAEKGGRP